MVGGGEGVPGEASVFCIVCGQEEVGLYWAVGLATPSKLDGTPCLVFWCVEEYRYKDKICLRYGMWFKKFAD